MLKEWKRTFVLPGGFESRTTLKICMHMRKQDVSMFQKLSKKVMNVNQFWNSIKHVSSFQI
jgi:hypothetical protein